MGVVKYLRAQWDRAAGMAFMIAGAVGVVLGWIGVSGAVYPAEQLPYLVSGGLGGLFLLGVGATLWLSADLRDEWRHLDTLESDVEQRLTARLEALVATAVHAESTGHSEADASAESVERREPVAAQAART